MPLSAPSDAAFIAWLISSTVVSRPAVKVRSTADPVGTGTRSAYPSSLPFSSGSTSPIALAAPVEVGTMFSAAARARPRALCGPSCRVALDEHLERLATDADLVGRRLHLVRQPAQDAVVLEQVGEYRVVGEVVDADELDVGPPVESRPEEVTADPAEAVDANTDGHETHLLARGDGSGPTLSEVPLPPGRRG